jgi:DNA-binding response OmpR family regulator
MITAVMKPKVLAVDDDPEFTELISYTLGREGCQVLVASNGVQALNLARSELPDVILLDLMLPDLDGISVFQILRSQPSTRKIPVIIVSALGESWTGLRGTRPQYQWYLKKPVDLKALARLVQAPAARLGTLPPTALTRPNDSADLDGRGDPRPARSRGASPRRILE